MNLRIFVLSIGLVNIDTGKTMYDWSIYENGPGTVYLTNTGSLLYGSAGAGYLVIGDTYELRGNDSQRLLQRGKIIDTAPTTREAVLAMLKKNGYDCNPIKAFRKRAPGNKNLGLSYSIKGAEDLVA